MKSTTYSILAAYKAGHLAQIWREQTQTMRALSSQFSPLRCGEIIAAKLAKQAEKEYAILEAKLKPVFYLSFEEARLYSWLVNGNYNCLDAQLFTEQKACGENRLVLLKEELINLSGTQTLIVDMDMLDSKRGNKTYYIIEGDPPYLLILELHDKEPRKVQVECTRKWVFEGPSYNPGQLEKYYAHIQELNAYMLKIYTEPVLLERSAWINESLKRQRPSACQKEVSSYCYVFRQSNTIKSALPAIHVESASLQGVILYQLRKET